MIGHREDAHRIGAEDEFGIERGHRRHRAEATRHRQVAHAAWPKNKRAGDCPPAPCSSAGGGA
jgi:hypothetical protein